MACPPGFYPADPPPILWSARDWSLPARSGVVPVRRGGRTSSFQKLKSSVGLGKGGRRELHPHPRQG